MKSDGAMICVGVDIIEVGRIAAAINRHGERFFGRFFTERELALSGGRIPTLAARFAAKEAAAKALGTGIGQVKWVELEVLADGNGRPSLQLHGEAERVASELGLSEWTVSLTHTQWHAMAFVVARSAHPER
jgi:holo-[acyl-carrier protein] synthase